MTQIIDSLEKSLQMREKERMTNNKIEYEKLKNDGHGKQIMKKV